MPKISICETAGACPPIRLVDRPGAIGLFKTINGALLATELDSGLDFLMRESAYASALENISLRLLQRVAPVLNKPIAPGLFNSNAGGGRAPCWRGLNYGKCTCKWDSDSIPAIW